MPNYCLHEFPEEKQTYFNRKYFRGDTSKYNEMELTKCYRQRKGKLCQ